MRWRRHFSDRGRVSFVGCRSTANLRWCTKGRGVNDCHFPPGGNLILACSTDHTLRLWCVVSGELLKTFEGHSNSVRRCRFAPEGKTILSASKDRALKLWDLALGALQKTLVGHQRPVLPIGCDFAPDGATILRRFHSRSHPEIVDHRHGRPSAHRKFLAIFRPAPARASWLHAWALS